MRRHPRGSQVDLDGRALHAVLQVAAVVPDGGGAGGHHLQGSHSTDFGQHSLILCVLGLSGRPFRYDVYTERGREGVEKYLKCVDKQYTALD